MSLAKNLSRTLTLRSQIEDGITETVKIKDIIFASTGVIGEKFLLIKLIEPCLKLVQKLKIDQNKLFWLKVASSMMTTDTKPKLAYEEFDVGNKTIKISGLAKGSGMIAPNLATMLSFIFTDVDIPSNILKTLLKELSKIL